MNGDYGRLNWAKEIPKFSGVKISVSKHRGDIICLEHMDHYLPYSVLPEPGVIILDKCIPDLIEHLQNYVKYGFFKPKTETYSHWGVFE